MDILPRRQHLTIAVVSQIELTSRANSIRPDSVRRQSRSQLFHHERGASFALPIRITSGCQSVESPYATGCNDLASLLHVAFLVPFVEEHQESHHCIPNSGSIDTKRVNIIIEIHLPHLPLEILKRSLGRDLGLWSSDAGIGYQNVDVANFFLNSIGNGFEGFFGRNIAHYWDDVIRSHAFSCAFKGGFASANNVDFMSAIESQGSRHHQSNA
jgi:hypothetical protein